MSDELHDDAWVRELQRRAAPLRVELPTWGDVLARDAWREPGTVAAAPRRGRLPIAVAVAFAAGAVLALAWGGPYGPTVTAPEVPLPVAAPGIPSPEPAPASNVAPTPTSAPTPASASTPASAPIVPAPEAAASAVVPVVPRPKPVPRVRPRPHTKPPSTPAIDLPETLGTGDIKDGLAPIKPAVRACADRHGGVGLRVTVKLTISGESGRVTSASLVAPDDPPPGLGDCVLAAVQQAQFPRFRSAALGVVYPFQL